MESKKENAPSLPKKRGESKIKDDPPSYGGNGEAFAGLGYYRLSGKAAHWLSILTLFLAIGFTGAGIAMMFLSRPYWALAFNLAAFLSALTFAGGLIYAAVSRNRDFDVAAHELSDALHASLTAEGSEKGKRSISLIRGLRGRLSEMQSVYEQYRIVYVGSSQNQDIREAIAKGKEVSTPSFALALRGEIESNPCYRSALIVAGVKSDGGEVKPELLALLAQSLHQYFPHALISAPIEGKIYCYLYAIDNLTSLNYHLQDISASLTKLSIPMEGEKASIFYPVFGVAPYPDFVIDQLQKAAEDAYARSGGIEFATPAKSKAQIPNRIPSEGNLSDAARRQLSNLSAEFDKAEGAEAELSVLKSLVQWMTLVFHYDEGGVLLLDEEASYYENLVCFGRGASLSHGKEGSLLPREKIDALFSLAASEEPFFTVSESRFLPSDFVSYFQRLGVVSLFLKPFYANGRPKALFYLFSKEFLSPISRFQRDSMIVSLSLAGRFLDGYRASLNEEEGDQRFNALASHTKSYVYSIDRATHRLTYLSRNLQSAFPRAKVGDVCYEALRSNHTAPCSHCPLATGLDRRSIPAISEMPCRITTLDFRNANPNRASLLIEPEEKARESDSLEMDSLLNIPTQRALFRLLAKDIREGSFGYLLLARLDDAAGLSMRMGTTNADPALTRLAVNLEDYGYGDVLFRYDATTLALYLRSHNRSKAISVMEGVAAVLSEPISQSGAKLFAGMDYALIAYPGEANSPRQLSTLGEDMLLQARSKGANYVSLRSMERPRHALRSEYVADLLKQAVDEDSMSVQIQPVVHAGGHGLEGADIRASLLEPSGALVSAAEFIPLAQRDGLVSRIDLSSLSSAGKLYQSYGASEFPGRGIQHLGIHISDESLKGAGFVGAVKAIFLKYRFPKNYIVFDLPLSLAMSEGGELMRLMKETAPLGIAFEVVDVSLSDNPKENQAILNALSTIGVHRFKFAASVLSQAMADPRTSQDLSRFCDNAKKSGLSFCFLGVENGEEEELAESKGADRLEGYLYGHPQGEDAFLKTVLDWPF